MQMAKLAPLLGLIVVTSSPSFAEDITNKVQEMRRFSDQEAARQESQRYQQYLRSNDAANGISQRSGPTGSIAKDGGSVGYKWTTK
jgi:hypothetical protein